MGAICHFQLQSSETQSNQETQHSIPISKESKPNPINSSIKHDLRAKCLELDCHFCVRPQMREMASQTQVSIFNITPFNVLKKQKTQRNKKNKQKEMDNQLSQSQYQDLINQFSKQKNKLQEIQPYVVLINSQKETISQRSYQKKNKKLTKTLQK